MPMSPVPDTIRQPTNDENCHFTVFIRLPFPRGDFVDPPTIEWDAAKDRVLWDVLSRIPKGREVDWQGLAEQFDVTLPFLLQQAAWLYEQQLSQVKAQLRKANRPASIGTSPTPGSASGSGIAGGHGMTRGGSGDPRVPSALSNRPRDRPVSQSEGSTAELPVQIMRRQLSRNPSTNTVLQVPRLSPSVPQRPSVERKSSFAPSLRARTTSDRSIDAFIPPRPLPPPPQRDAFEKDIESPLTSSSSSSSSHSNAPALASRSLAYMRRSRYTSSKTLTMSPSDGDEDQDSPPFLPFSDTKAITPNSPKDSSSTVLINPKRPPSHGDAPGSFKAEARPLPQTAHSSSSSTQSQLLQSPNARSVQNPLSSLSPRQRRITREGSEGSPSMGSSFSDLDDASVTQSALEEAYAHEIQHGASRMSTISQALRSRYLSG